MTSDGSKGSGGNQFGTLDARTCEHDGPSRHVTSSGDLHVRNPHEERSGRGPAPVAHRLERRDSLTDCDQFDGGQCPHRHCTHQHDGIDQHDFRDFESVLLLGKTRNGSDSDSIHGLNAGPRGELEWEH